MITCKLCGKRFQDIGGLSKHRSKAHPGAGKRKKQKTDLPKGVSMFVMGGKNVNERLANFLESQGF